MRMAEGGLKVAFLVLLLMLASFAMLAQISNLASLQILSVVFYIFVPGYLASLLMSHLAVWERILASLGLSIGLQQALQNLFSILGYDGLATSRVLLIGGVLIVTITMLITLRHPNSR